MRLIRGIDRRPSVDLNPPSRKAPWIAVLAVLLAACTADGVTAPDLSPAPAAQQRTLRREGEFSGGIRADEPIIFIVDGKRVSGDVYRTIDVSRIATIEVRRKGADRPENEVHITLLPPAQ